MMHLLPWIRNWGFELLIHCSVAHIKLPNPMSSQMYLMCHHWPCLGDWAFEMRMMP
jgi:hypothetical protein